MNTTDILYAEVTDREGLVHALNEEVRLLRAVLAMTRKAINLSDSINELNAILSITQGTILPIAREVDQNYTDIGVIRGAPTQENLN